MFDYSYEVERWLDQERRRIVAKRHYAKPFVGARGYPHFDGTIRLQNHEQITKLEQALGHIPTLQAWGFLPFVQTDLRSRRFRGNPPAPEYDEQGVIHRDQKKYPYIKNRPIMYASHRDACLYSFFGFLLTPFYETALSARTLDANVLAYRSIDGKNNVDFAKEAFEYLQEKDNYVCILLDIHAFFGSIPHDRLLINIVKILGKSLSSELLHILRSLITYRSISEDKIYQILRKAHRPYHIGPRRQTKKLCRIEDYNELLNNSKVINTNRRGVGIPQGSPVSGLLANIFLLEFDNQVRDLVEALKFGIYRRYSDDILIVCPRADVEELYEQIKALIRSHGLSISRNKTEGFEKSAGTLRNITTELEPKLHSKRRQVQYLGLEWNGKQIVLRPATPTRRMRPIKDWLKARKWDYHKMAISKVGDPALARQYDHMRETVKQFIKDKQSRTDRARRKP